MATKKGGAKKVEKGKKEKKKQPARKVHTQYEVQGNSVKRLKNSCPKCGPSVNMGAHKNRSTCGQCGYTEFKKE
jgi:ubiquitin-small subunit ribosomal protein S27Ae